MYLLIYCSSLLYIFVQFKIASGILQRDVEVLEEILERTNIFFTNLKFEYTSYPHNTTTHQLIDTQITQFTKDVEKRGKVYERAEIGNAKLNHQERDQEFDILADFKILSKWNLHNAIDVISINQRNNKEESITFVLTLEHDGVSLVKLNHDEYIPIDFYSLANGESITVIKNLIEHNNMLVMVKKTSGYTIILNLNHDPANGTLRFHYIQTLITTRTNSLAAWYGMNGVLYFGSVSASGIILYSWTKEKYFKLYQQILHSGAEYLIPLRINETHAMSFATACPTTRIFTFHLILNRYILMQNLGESQDIVELNVHTLNKRLSGHFIVLVKNMSTIVYRKNDHNLYIPFQQLELGKMKRVHSLVQDRTVYLVLIPKQFSEKTKVFRYNKWKFIDTQIKLRNGRFEDVTLPFLRADQWHFFAKFESNGGNKSTWRVLRMNNDNKNATNWCDKMRRNLQSKRSYVILSEFSILNQSGYDDADSVTDMAGLSMIQDGIDWRKKGLKELFNTKMSTKVFMFDGVKEKNVHALLCVSAGEIKSASINETIQNFIQHREDKNVIWNNYELRNVTINSNVNQICPIPAVTYKKIKTKRLMNGIASFGNLLDDLLKLNMNNNNDYDCQIITGAHSINSIETIDTIIPSFEIGFNLTHQNIITSNITIDELEIIPGGVLLPVNHTGVYELTGTLSVKKAKIMKLIELNGHINGTSVAHLLPIVHYREPIILDQHSNRNFKYLQIMESVIANDIVGLQPKQSYNLVTCNSFSLESIKISTHMILQMNAVDWNDVYMTELFGNWLTIRNSEITDVTGLKMIPPSVQLYSIGHEIVSVSTFENTICTLAVFIDDIYTSSIAVNRARLQEMNADAIFGDINADHLINAHPNGIDANNANQLDSIDWIRAGILRGPIKSHILIVDNVNAHKHIVLPFPREIKKMVAKKKCMFDNINGIIIHAFLHDVATIHNPIISLIDIEHSNRLEVNEITVLDELPINFLNNIEFTFDYGVKTVARKIETENVDILFISEFVESYNKSNVREESAMGLVIAGAVTFTSEPQIRKMNNWIIADLFEDIWLKNEAAILKGNLIYLNRMVITDGSMDIGNSFNIPDRNNTTSWSQFRETVLSKSRSQNIPQMSQFDRVYVFRQILGSSMSRIISKSSTNLYNLENYTFQKCHKRKGEDIQFMIVNNWQFTIINSMGTIEIIGKVNNLNLNIDVVRTDQEENVVTAAKMIDYLNVNVISHYSKLQDLVENSLMTRIKKKHLGERKNVIIRGRTRFRIVEMMNLSVNGEIAGKKIENCIQRKKTHQYFWGRKVFKGSVTAREFIIDEKTSINGIHLINFLKYHLRKKFNDTQIILHPISFQRGLKIFGSAKVDKWYQNLRMIDGDSWNVHKFQKHMDVMKQKMRRLNEITSTIGDVIPNHVIYWDKLAFVDAKNFELDDSLLLTSLLPMETPKPILLENMGNCYIQGIVLMCNNNEILVDFSSVLNINHVIKFKLLSIGDKKIFIAITSAPGSVIIFSYLPEFQKFELRMKLEMPDILDGTIEKAHNSVWIALAVRDRTIIMRYKIWNELEQFFLPPTLPMQTIQSDICVQKLIAITHSDYDEELLFVHNDGIWRIVGMSQPKRIISNIFIRCPSKDIFVMNNNLYFRLIDVHSNTSHLLKALCINK